ncbi:MAG: TolC family protein [Bacteroidales bacterium]|nr:TolC family protein [Bacteroidales bacterium]MDD4292798.1 TolC family protein [Bacteroidales bacterium]HNW48383.1 TolC family protein [Bacteroidales bacterium]HPS95174.1 TolC family protein [Bacteroidales bacterium]
MKILGIVKTGALILSLTLSAASLRGQAPAGDTLKITIGDALEIALNENLNIKMANSELQRVDYLKQENWNALLPAVNASAQYTNNIMKPVFFSDFFPGGKMEVGSTNSYSITGTLQVPVFSMALYKNIQLSEIEIKSALESARTTKLDLIQQVKNSFYGVVMLQKSIEVLEQSFKNARESADNIKKMYEQGMASEYDKIRSDVAARNISPSLTQARNGLELAKMQLKVLMSVNINQPIEIVGDFDGYNDQIANYNWNGELNVDENSTLKTMDIQLEKLNKTYELVRSQRLPVLAGFANYQMQMQNEEFKFNKPWANSFAVGLSLQVPIFNKLSVSLKEKQTKAGIQKLEYQRDLIKENLSLAVQNSVNEMRRAGVQLISDKEAVQQAQKGYEISKVRFNTGVGTVLELNDSEVALTRSKLNYNQTLFDFIKAKNEFEKSTGMENLEK